MKKLFTILFAFLAVVLLTSKFQGPENDKQTSYQTEKVKLIVKFKEGVFRPDNYRHTIEDIYSNSVQKLSKSLV